MTGPTPHDRPPYDVISVFDPDGELPSFAYTAGAFEAYGVVGGAGRGARARRGAGPGVPAAATASGRLIPTLVVPGANAAAARLGRGVVTVVPVTANTDRVFPFQVPLPAAATGLDADSKAQAEQVRSVSVARVTTAVGVVPAPLMDQIDDALRLHLSL